MTNLLALLYLTLGVFIVIVEVQRIWSRKSFNALSLFNGAYFLLFVFAPLNVLILGEMAVRQKYAYQTWSHGGMWTAIALLASYVFFVLGYYSRRKNSAVITHNIGPKVIHVSLWLVGSYFLLGFIALAYHVSLMGGAIEALQFAQGSRTGEFKLEGEFLFIRQFTIFLATAFMLLWAVHIDTVDSNIQMRALCWLLLTILGLVFVYYALSTYGRREFLVPIIICLMIWALAGKRHLGGLVLLTVLCVLWFVVYSIMIPWLVHDAVVHDAVVHDAVVSYLVVFLWEGYIRTIQGLNDSFMQFVASEHAELWQFGFLTDLREIPAQFLPSQLLGFDRPRGMFGETSEFILGRPLEAGFSGEEPLGMHGYLLVNFSYLGMFIIFYLGGVGYRYLDMVLRPREDGSALLWLIYLWVIIGALEFLRHGVFILVLKPRFSWWLAAGILIWYGYRHAVRRSQVVK